MNGSPLEMPLRETKFAPSELYVSSRSHLRHCILVPTCPISEVNITRVASEQDVVC